MTFTAPTHMSDRELLVATRRVVDADRQTTAELLALLAEVDARKLYRGEGHSSLFTYGTHALRLSEPAAYRRITAARAARRFPTILTRLANGDLTLTTITLLASHLTDDNHEALLDTRASATSSGWSPRSIRSQMSARAFGVSPPRPRRPRHC